MFLIPLQEGVGLQEVDEKKWIKKALQATPRVFWLHLPDVVMGAKATPFRCSCTALPATDLPVPGPPRPPDHSPGAAAGRLCPAGTHE